jgi:hypothetical protein
MRNNHESKNFFKDSEIERISNRMNSIDPENPEAHDKWKSQIIAGIIILAVLIGLVIFIYIR